MNVDGPNWSIDREHRIEFSPSNESATIALLAGLSDVAESNSVDWPALEESLPTEELNRLIAEGDDVTITFSYEGLPITVRDDGLIIIHNPDSAGRQGNHAEY